MHHSLKLFVFCLSINYLTDGEWAAGVFPFINNFTRNEKEKRIKGSSYYFEQFLNKLVIF